MRCFTQCIYAERAGKPEMAGSIAKWDETLRSIEAREISLETPKAIAQGWVDQGVLLLNSSLTISRFSAQGDPHQVRGHLPLWRPLIVRVLQHLSNESERTVPIVLFGDVAKATFRAAEPGFDRNLANPLIVIETEHPAAGDAFLLNGNPLTHCNEHLRALGEQPIRW